ncbi:MAG: DUF4340 domain-containing protein, partial [Candidatus Hydrogenedentota bacterium]
TVDRLEIYAGVKSRERVVLTLVDEQWKVASLFDARAVKGRAQQMLDAVASLQGEFRAKVTDDALADYDLTDERAFHTIGFTGDRQEVFHVLTGKSPKYGDMFMRASGSDNVYIVNKNIRRDAFLYSLDYDDPPKSLPWLDKQIVGIKGDDFTKMELTMTDKIMVAEKRDIPKEEAESFDSEEPDTSIEITEAEKEWVVTQGGFKGDLHQTPFRDLERYVSNLTAMTAISPEKETIWGTDNPNYHLTMHRENGELIDLEISHPSLNGPAYVKRIDNDDETLYSIELSKFEALFAAGGAYYDLPGLLLEEDSMTTMEYTSPDGTVKIAKEGDHWNVASPVSDLLVDQTHLTRMERVLSSWQAADYADAATDGGFSDSQHSVSFIAGGQTHRITLGSESRHIMGRYAQLDNSADALVMSFDDFNKIFLPVSKMFQLHLVPVDDDDEIVHVEMTHGDSNVVFDLGDLGWEATAEDDTFEPQLIAIDSHLTSISGAEADDVSLAAPTSPAEAAGSLLIKSDKGSEWRLDVAKADEETYSVSLNGSKSTYTISQELFGKLFPALESFKAAEGEETVSFQAPQLDPAPVDDGHDH